VTRYGKRLISLHIDSLHLRTTERVGNRAANYACRLDGNATRRENEKRQTGASCYRAWCNRKTGPKAQPRALLGANRDSCSF